VLGAERLDALLTESGRRCGGGVAPQERERDGAGDVGEDGLGAGPEAVQQGPQLVAGSDPLVDQVVAAAHRGTQGSGGVGEWLQDPQLGVADPQVIGDHVCISGVGLGAGDDLGLPPDLDGVGLDRPTPLHVAGMTVSINATSITSTTNRTRPGGTGTCHGGRSCRSGHGGLVGRPGRHVMGTERVEHRRSGHQVGEQQPHSQHHAAVSSHPGPGGHLPTVLERTARPSRIPPTAGCGLMRP